ncbi:hypothetical protein VNI00_009432 [Paramarasmius palmivorus]|uniref:Uncharacterized protein n=1 Tax=Paramarasmius palmivorus TaxID=297713 RepID=A0AAW0CP62_9AGAR
MPLTKSTPMTDIRGVRTENEADNTTTNYASVFKGSDACAFRSPAGIWTTSNILLCHMVALYSDAKCLDQLEGSGRAVFHTTNGTKDKAVIGSKTNNMSVIGGKPFHFISIIVSYTFPVADSSDNVTRGSNMIPEIPRLDSSEFKTDNFGNGSTTKNHTGHQGAFVEGEPGGTYNFETANIGSENITYNDVDLPAESASTWSLSLQSLAQYFREFSDWSTKKKDGTVHRYYTSNKGGNNYIKNGD